MTGGITKSFASVFQTHCLLTVANVPSPWMSPTSAWRAIGAYKRDSEEDHPGNDAPMMERCSERQFIGGTWLEGHDSLRICMRLSNYILFLTKMQHLSKEQTGQSHLNFQAPCRARAYSKAFLSFREKQRLYSGPALSVRWPWPVSTATRVASTSLRLSNVVPS